MYRISSGVPTQSILRIGTIDDFNLFEEKLKPRMQQFLASRVGWLGDVEGVKKAEVGEQSPYYLKF